MATPTNLASLLAQFKALEPDKKSVYVALLVIIVALLSAFLVTPAYAGDGAEDPAANPCDSGGQTLDDTMAMPTDCATTALEADADIWAFYGWASAGYAFVSQETAGTGNLPFTHSELFLAAPPDSPTLFGLAPRAVLVYAMQAGSHFGVVDATTYHQLGADTDSYAGVIRVDESTGQAGALGVAYFPDILITDEAGAVYKPVQLHGYMVDGGGFAARVRGWYPISHKSPFSYMVVADGTWEPEGDSRGRLLLRHHTSADLSTFIEAGVVNQGDQTLIVACFGSTF